MAAGGRQHPPLNLARRRSMAGSSLLVLGVGALLQAGAAPTVPIHVQGSWSRSPLEGQVVTSRGVVTGVKPKGFFIQTPPGGEHAHSTTSAGLWVFTGSRPPGPIQVGTVVAVRGRCGGIPKRWPGEGVVVLGDCNAFEFNDGYVDVVGTVAGRPAPVEEVVVGVPPVLLHPPRNVFTLQMAGVSRSSSVYQSNPRTVDYLVVSGELVPLLRRVEGVPFNADCPVAWRNDHGPLRRLSDHDPVGVHLRRFRGEVQVGRLLRRGGPPA